jgi:hypothetical protein
MRWSTSLLGFLLLFAGRAEASCAWRADELLRISGETEQGNLSGTFTRTTAPASGRFAEAIDLGMLKSGRGFDGRLAWSQDVSGASHYLTSEFARRLAVSEAWVTAHLGCPAARGALGREVVQFTPPKGAPIELRYDRRTGRLESAALQYSENRLIHHYADWRAIPSGHAYPFLQRDEDPEDESDTIYKVRNVAAPTKASFAPPAPPRDSRIVGGDSTTIAFEDDQRRRVFLPVYLNGKGPFAFELDNGAHFILTEETARELGLTAQGNFSSTGAGNAIRQSGYALVDKLQLGRAEVRAQPAKVLALSHNDRGALPPRAGILGLEFFERFIVGVDHRRKTVTLRLISDRAPSFEGRPLRLLFDEDAPLVSGSYDGVSGNIMLDIGNAGATIIEDYWAAQHGLRARLARGAPQGSAKLSPGAVALGPFRLKDETVTYLGPAERGSEFTRSVAAIAGEPLLSRFNAVYDYGHQTVWLQPLPEMQPVPFQKRP